MKRCGKPELHEPHEWIDEALRKDCDGRTVNAPMVGQCTVAELRAALAEEQDGAIVAVAVKISGVTSVSALATPDPDRQKGLPGVHRVQLEQTVKPPSDEVLRAARQRRAEIAARNGTCREWIGGTNYCERPAVADVDEHGPRCAQHILGWPESAIRSRP